jgi:phosphatidylserine decarboxylase
LFFEEKIKYSTVMRIPLTKYGCPEVIVYPITTIIIMGLLGIVGTSVLPLGLILIIEGILGVLLLWSLSFFRDPHRQCPGDPNVLLAPADGRITDITHLDTCEFINGPAWRIGIFLSIFDVHINRAPCCVRVEDTLYRPGLFRNAMNKESGRVNESNDLYFINVNQPQDRIIVRQISGAIARRIVCKTIPGQQLLAGEKFGMIKFGSRTELYIPARRNIKCQVQEGDKARAGLTILARYES